MFKLKIFCNHEYKIERAGYSHGPKCSEPAFLVGIAVCMHCGKEILLRPERGTKEYQMLKKACCKK